MNYKSYHHGNLREALIEAGIECINENGLEVFSLRKVATLCGVSHAAPYNHFKTKEELIDAMQNYISEKFVTSIQQAIESHGDDPELMIFIGKAYVLFFAENPQYFQFFIRYFNSEIWFVGNQAESNYAPFILFQKAAIQCMKQWGLPEKTYMTNIITMWAIVHGVANFISMGGVKYDGDWGKLIENILRDKIRFSMPERLE
jgi:AcrR family transcriptional regulator